MLGVRRTSVTLVARTLQQTGMIKYSRAKIQVIDIEAMRETACECYGTLKSNYGTLLLDPTNDSRSRRNLCQVSDLVRIAS